MTRRLVIHDGRVEREVLLVGTIVVGRDPSCHINDLDPLLSRRHAEFVTTAAGVTLRDLGSRNGILVNGTKAREHVLVAGDLVQLGHLQVRYLEEQTPVTNESSYRAHATTASAVNLAAVGGPIGAPPPELDPDDTRRHAPVVLEPAADHELTRAPGRIDEPAPLASTDFDATVAPSVIASGAPDSWDMDVTIGPGARAVDVTMAPAAHSPSVVVEAALVPADAETTCVVTHASRSVDAPDVGGAPALLVAGPDLCVVSATPACEAALGALPGALIGRSVAELLSLSLHSVAKGGGPASLTLVIERQPADRTIRVTLTPGPIGETRS